MTEMKDSGFAWTGSIPKNWKMERLQWHLDEINEKNDPVKTESILSLTNKLGVIPYEDKGDQGNKAKTDVSQYKIAYSNTIVANSMNILIGSVGISKYYGCVSPVYYVFRAKKGSNLKFVNYILQCPQFQKELRKYANGILEIRLRLSSADILKRPVPFPDLETQNQIVDYLDYKCADIDSAVSEAKASIEDYKALKQSIITQAVTKGLNPNAEMKGSGIEWIGEIPCSWKMTKLKYVAEFNPSVDLPIDENSPVGYTPMECIKNGYMLPREIMKSKASTGLTYYQENDIVIAKVTPCFENGNIAIASGLAQGVAYGSSELFIIRPHAINELFLFYYLQSDGFKSAAKATMTGTGGLKRVSGEFVNNLPIPYPDMNTQVEIVEYIQGKVKAVDDLVREKAELISDLEAYKKSLIYECVTGKREVPNA